MTLAAALGLPATTAFRRAPRTEVARSAFDKADPYAILMACWQDYMHTDDRDLGSRGMKLTSDAEIERDVGTEQYLANLKIGEAVNAMVDSLTIQHRWAIYRSQGISTAWRFVNASYEEVLLAARASLEEKLRGNVATRLYFS